MDFRGSGSFAGCGWLFAGKRYVVVSIGSDREKGCQDFGEPSGGPLVLKLLAFCVFFPLLWAFLGLVSLLLDAVFALRASLPTNSVGPKRISMNNQNGGVTMACLTILGLGKTICLFAQRCEFCAAGFPRRRGSNNVFLGNFGPGLVSLGAGHDRCRILWWG
ncbi:MAG: hypothetical protein CM15mP68_6700 [Pseudomonadota bacterium]|nr:MAG: hypothetical protein CM15mP68_6700 [Pseudomonadota bacterium]